MHRNGHTSAKAMERTTCQELPTTVKNFPEMAHIDKLGVMVSNAHDAWTDHEQEATHTMEYTGCNGHTFTRTGKKKLSYVKKEMRRTGHTSAKTVERKTCQEPPRTVKIC